MQLVSNSNILIVGLGLMGGSYAKALSRVGFHVNAIAHKQADIDYAMERGFIEKGADWADPELIGNAELVIFALYPHVFKEWIEENQKYFRPGTLITDVTGVKRCVVYDIQEILRDDVEFIAAHPMAGRETSGIQSADDTIFRDANYIVVPTEKNTPEAIESCKSLGRVMGFSRITELTPEKHDEMIAFVSQLTHCIAISLMTCNDADHIGTYTGDSFRDLTRIANINENMWTELFVDNMDALIHQMDLFSAEFGRLRWMLASRDIEGMKETMRKSTARRIALDQGR
ncbi:MAG: prephenate dehydrogenase [Oscillospiraceae bacterium]|nr:prephenate dehydrogenase [Oscillospiraceae bacterium]MBQ6403285.1 prephenate dehydrogenase [Oscillospiraceae bacterium]